MQKFLSTLVDAARRGWRKAASTASAGIQSLRKTVIPAAAKGMGRAAVFVKEALRSGWRNLGPAAAGAARRTWGWLRSASARLPGLGRRAAAILRSLPRLMPKVAAWFYKLPALVPVVIGWFRSLPDLLRQIAAWLRDFPTHWKQAVAWLRGLPARWPEIRTYLVDRLGSLGSMVVLVFKRLRFNLGISISALIGIISVMAIVVCVPIFSHAVSSEVLRQQLQEKVNLTHRTLFSLHSYYLDKSTASPLSVAQTATVTNFIHDNVTRQLGVRVDKIYLELQSASAILRPTKTQVANVNTDDPWVSLRFNSLDDLPAHANLLEGAWPIPVTSPNDPIQVAVIGSLADADFINVGDIYRFRGAPILVTGIWEPKDLTDPYWFDTPSTAFADKMWVPLETYQSRLGSLFDRPVFYASWYVVVADNSLRFQRAPQYAQGLVRVDSEMRRLLPGITTDYSPLDALKTYQGRAESLTTLFYAVGGPMIILALLFIGLTATIAVQQYEQETLTLRGRGGSWGQVALLNITESIILVVLAFIPSVLMGWLSAEVMGHTVSFLKFTSRSPLSFSLDGLNLVWVLIAVLMIVLARFLPILNVSRTTIVRMKQEQSRAAKKPIWERFYLDFFLLIPGIYSYVTMSGIAKPAKFLSGLQAAEGQYRDPLLFVSPALFAMAICMILLRILPLLVRGVAVLAEKLPGAWAYLSLQQIARRPQDHSSALLLIMISLSLSIFSASTAKTLDQWLYDSVYYKSGADLAVHEYVLTGNTPNAYGAPGQTSSPATTVSELDINTAGYVSLDDHLKLPTVENVTRVGKYDGTFSFGVGELPCTVMGIDRLDFPKVAFYRNDFANGKSLGAVMNELGADPNGVLIPAALAKENGFRIGDHVVVSMTILNVKVDRDMTIMGLYDYFPTVMPSERPTMIVNLDSIFDNPDAAVGYDIWLKLRKDADIPVVLFQLRKLIGSDRAMVDVHGNAMAEVKKGLEEPERVGLFGVINVGFLATGLMPGIGFVLYSYASLRRRFIQLGILQAIGLSVRQLIGYLVSEQFFLMMVAISTGAVIGLVTSMLFVPFLQVGASTGAPVPPFKVLIGWVESGWLSLAFGVVLCATIAGTIWYLGRLKVFQAVKMGETL